MASKTANRPKPHEDDNQPIPPEQRPPEPKIPPDTDTRPRYFAEESGKTKDTGKDVPGANSTVEPQAPRVDETVNP
ncbi:MAG: hypothetical protein KF802_04235 [Bdellovibrionaceae bacterium]|nr:hypothetical protein [Pseudobdellovibrionaceae bacterium]MBX3034232.1 hypothetical protein [Pseudobdellovibrionaceae bacterium]